MVKEFNELEVWQIGKGIVVKIYQLTKNFPRQETYGLVDQLRRASNSICANIAEGFERYHTKDKVRFYYFARGSISECKSHLLISQDLNYLNKDEVDKLVQELTVVGVKLNNMIASLFRIAASR
ncbi:MAG: four helix bundle protein, partial [Candidatus Margulisiibacteriota bacterium]